MRTTTLLLELLGLKQTRVVGFEFTTTELLVDVEPATRTPHCGRCGARCSTGYDQRQRRWRHVDIVGLQVVLRHAMGASIAIRTALLPSNGGWR